MFDVMITACLIVTCCYDYVFARQIEIMIPGKIDAIRNLYTISSYHNELFVKLEYTVRDFVVIYVRTLCRLS